MTRRISFALFAAGLLLGGLAASPQAQAHIERGWSVVSSGVLRFPLGTKIQEASNGVLTLLDNAGTSFTRLQFGGTTSSYPSLKRSGASLVARLADDSNDASFTAAAGNFTQVNPSTAAITSGSGTGINVNDGGRVQSVVYKATIAKEAFVAAATTADATIATLPAKTILKGIYADVTQTFACTATCTSSTLSMVVGRGSGGAEFLASFDADAAAAQFGDADAELGTEMVRAAAIQGGALGSWASTQAVVLRLTSGTGNIGNGTATNLSQGSVTVYLITERLP